MTPEQWVDSGFFLPGERIPRRDAYGVDGFAYDGKTKTWHAIQAKMNQSNRALTQKDLETFVSSVFRMRGNKNSPVVGYLYSWGGRLTGDVERNFRACKKFIHRRFRVDAKDWDDEMEARAQQALASLRRLDDGDDEEEEELSGTETETDSDDCYSGESGEEYIATQEDENENEDDEDDDDGRMRGPLGRAMPKHNPILRRSTRIGNQRRVE